MFESHHLHFICADEKSISSLQISFNGPLKDSKYKTSEQRFQNDIFFRHMTTPLL